MNKTLYIVTSFILVVITGCTNTPTLPEQKLTGINPLAYTDVTYMGAKDTVLVATYSGRVAMRCKDNPEETVISQLNDEVYSLAFHEKNDHIIAATLESGVVIIERSSGNIFKTLPLSITSWMLLLRLSKDQKYLYGFDKTGKNYIWDVDKNYALINYPESLPRSVIRYVGTDGNAYHVGARETFVYDIPSEEIKQKFNVNGRLVDVDTNGDLLILGQNDVRSFDIDKEGFVFKKEHPNWIFHIGEKDTDTVHIPFQFKLTTARYGADKVYSAGIDRSIRVWNKNDGSLIKDLIGHRATISSIQINDAKNQLVSVDLKGGLRFWELR